MTLLEICALHFGHEGNFCAFLGGRQVAHLRD